MSRAAHSPHIEKALADDPADGLSTKPVQRGWILGLLLKVFVGVFVGLVAFDLGVDAYDSKQGADGGNRGIFTDERLGWLNRPHFENPEFETKLDRFGLRSPEIPDDAPLDELRLVGFGASNIYGAGGCKQTWCWNYTLEALLQQRLSSLRVLNGGVMAYSALQSCRLASNLLEAIEPDLVMVFISPGAQLMLDPSSARNWTRVTDGPGGLVPRDVLDGWPKMLHPLVAKSHHLMNAWSALYRRHRSKFQVNGERTQGIQRWMVSRQPRSPAVDAMFQETLAEFDVLADLCRRRGVELRVGVLADILQDSERVWSGFLRNNQAQGCPPRNTPRTEPTDVLVELLEERGIRCWNFFNEVDHIGKNRRRYIMPDLVHWNQAGHEVLARGIVKRLESEGLIAALLQKRRDNPRQRPYGVFPFDPEGS
jgi:hypothetical protein